MAGLKRYKYVVVLGSCSTADAIRPKELEDIQGARLRLLWYQGRTSLLSMATAGLGPEEVAYPPSGEEESAVNWARTMALDEAEKRQQERLLGVIGMSDALILDLVSGFGYPYLLVEPGERLFLQSKEWERYVELRAPAERRWLWEMPIERSLAALCQVLSPLYARQPELRVIFHLPRPAFNDGVRFDDEAVAAQIDFYHHYGERLFAGASRRFPHVSLVSCGGEVADPGHPNGPFPFHYDETYLAALRGEIYRLLVASEEVPASQAGGAG